MYDKIVNPLNGLSINVNSYEGKQIIQSYFKTFIGGANQGVSATEEAVGLEEVVEVSETEEVEEAVGLEEVVEVSATEEVEEAVGLEDMGAATKISEDGVAEKLALRPSAQMKLDQVKVGNESRPMETRAEKELRFSTAEIARLRSQVDSLEFAVKSTKVITESVPGIRSEPIGFMSGIPEDLGEDPLGDEVIDLGDGTLFRIAECVVGGVGVLHKIHMQIWSSIKSEIADRFLNSKHYREIKMLIELFYDVKADNFGDDVLALGYIVPAKSGDMALETEMLQYVKSIVESSKICSDQTDVVPTILPRVATLSDGDNLGCVYQADIVSYWKYLVKCKDQEYAAILKLRQDLVEITDKAVSSAMEAVAMAEQLVREQEEFLLNPTNADGSSKSGFKCNQGASASACTNNVHPITKVSLVNPCYYTQTNGNWGDLDKHATPGKAVCCPDGLPRTDVACMPPKPRPKKMAKRGGPTALEKRLL